MAERFRKWLLERAELSLADAEQHQSKWSWSYKPSEAARIEKLIARRKRRVERLGGSCA
jgi:hypothetical protein